MKYFARALDKLQGEKGVTMGHLLPTIESLKQRLRELEVQHCKTLCSSLLQGLDSRFSTFYQEKDCLISAVTHPA